MSLLKTLLNRSSITRKLLWQSLPNGLYVFTYHRIGEKSETAFDPNVYSCTESTFEQHLHFYQKHFKLLTVEQLFSLIKQGNIASDKYALITFDDGYIDNYTLAYPLLQKYSVPALIFLATDFIDQASIPWWDKIAWYTRNHEAQIKNQCKAYISSSFERLSLDDKIKHLLKELKKISPTELNALLIALEHSTNITLSPNKLEQPLFLNWSQVNEISENEIQFGSHTCTHQILSFLTLEQQRHEFSRSKEVIEDHINHTVQSAAFPVGGNSSFNEASISVLKQLEYQCSFTYEFGFNTQLNSESKYKIKRLPIDGNINTTQLKKIILQSI